VGLFGHTAYPMFRSRNGLIGRLGILFMAASAMLVDLHDGFAAPIVIDDFSVGPIEVAADPAGNTSLSVNQSGLDMDHVWSGGRFISAGTFGTPLPGTRPLNATITISEEGGFSYRANSIPERLYFQYGDFYDGTVLADLSSEGGRVIVEVLAASGWDNSRIIFGLGDSSGVASTQIMTIRNSADPYQLAFDFRLNTPAIDLANIIGIGLVIPAPGSDLRIGSIAFVPEPYARHMAFTGITVMAAFRRHRGRLLHTR
jgi:hypothetical protein